MYPAKRNTHCDHCSAPLTQVAGRGRPRRYCNDRCATAYRATAKIHGADGESTAAYPAHLRIL